MKTKIFNLTDEQYEKISTLENSSKIIRELIDSYFNNQPGKYEGWSMEDLEKEKNRLERIEAIEKELKTLDPNAEITGVNT